MSIRWNREKLVFAASLVVLGLVAWSTLGVWTGGGDAPQAIPSPQSSGSGAATALRLSWFELGDGGRSPFAQKSSWRQSVPDALAIPSITGLERRLPLPVLVHAGNRSRPLKETTPPDPKEEQ